MVDEVVDDVEASREVVRNVEDTFGLVDERKACVDEMTKAATMATRRNG